MTISKYNSNDIISFPFILSKILGWRIIEERFYLISLTRCTEASIYFIIFMPPVWVNIL